MLHNLNIEEVLFIDIETVPLAPEYNDLNEKWKQLWEHKMQFQINNDEPAEVLYDRAGIYAEFGRIICISVGLFNGNEFRIKSFYGEDEKILLDDFAQMLNRHYNQSQHLLCAHNGKEFDFPYIARRMLINGIELPDILQMAGKKPWEIRHLDTMELWKFGDYKNYTSLELLTNIFNIPTPKDDIDGSMVRAIFYQENDIERIVKYCQKDVLAIAQLMRRYMNQALIPEANVTYTK
jgi:uncharacterized protein YprB with RNaseH-like and TPR domain